MKRLLLGLGLVGCGDSPRVPDAQMCMVDPPTSGLALTSASFAPCAAIPAIHTCNGANASPPLAWTGAPGGTQSFAVVLSDLSLPTSLVHWVIYDVPTAAGGVPASIDKAYEPANVAGAHQTTGYDGQTRGYLGPCPPSQHIYRFAVYALDVAVLPAATMATTRDLAMPVIEAHKLATATLSGTYP